MKGAPGGKVPGEPVRKLTGRDGGYGVGASSIFPRRWVPLSASHSRPRVESTDMLRTTAPGVGIDTVGARSVVGSKATISFVPDSSYQMRPSLPIAMP